MKCVVGLAVSENYFILSTAVHYFDLLSALPDILCEKVLFHEKHVKLRRSSVSSFPNFFTEYLDPEDGKICK